MKKGIFLAKYPRSALEPSEAFPEREVNLNSLLSPLNQTLLFKRGASV